MADEGGVAAFGEALRQEREERGVAVEAICSTTKVPAKYIRALEAGKFQDLPGGVFRRGFVRSYLSALGLEENSWMRRFEESCRESGLAEPADREWATFAENVKNGRRRTRRQRSVKWLGGGVVVAALGSAGWCGWRLATHRSVVPHTQVWRSVKSWVDNATSR